MVGDRKQNFGPFALADPLALHRLDRVGPLDRVEVAQQPLGVARDAQQPLTQRAALDGVVADIALAIDDFFVGQHSPHRRAPVHHCLALVREPLRVLIFPDRVRVSHAVGDREFADGAAAVLRGVVPGVVDRQEDELRPAEVVGVGRIDLAVPVVTEAQRLDLPAERVHIRGGGQPRVGAGLAGVLLGRQTEGVPAHRVQHVEAVHPLEAGEDVGRRVAFRVADVQAGPTRVRKHVEDVVLRFAGHGRVAGIDGAEGLVRLPEVLPARLDLGGVVRRHNEPAKGTVERANLERTTPASQERERLEFLKRRLQSLTLLARQAVRPDFAQGVLEVADVARGVAEWGR